MNMIRNRKVLAGAITLAMASATALAQEPRIVSVVVMDDLDALVVLGENLQQAVARSRITLGDVGDITRHCTRSRGPEMLTMMTCTLPGGLPPAGDYMLTIEHFNNNGVVQSDYGLTIGAVGPQGPIGQDGARGPAGADGATGPQGVSGAAGQQGEQGLPGIAGSQGEQGQAGATGAEGIAGPQGEQGLTGAIGPQGDQGPTGAVGPQGDQGPTGAVGPQGVQGLIGAAGPQGEQGLTGAIGAIGPQGDQGPTGAVGPQGVQGLTGAVGPQGDIGPAGPQGLPGAAGPQGERGLMGLAGAQGSTGAMGPTGATGASGAVGPTGPQGPAGASSLADVRLATTTINIPARELRRGVAQCAANEVAFNGGMSVANHGEPGFNLDNVDGIYVNTSGVGRNAREWVVIATNVRMFASQNVTFWIACAPTGAQPANAAGRQAAVKWDIDGAKLAE